MKPTDEQRIAQSLRLMQSGVDDLNRALLGDNYGNKGIVGRLQDLEKDIDGVDTEIKDVKKQIDNIDKDNFKTKAKIAGVSAGIGASAALLGKAILAKAASLFPFIKP